MASAARRRHTDKRRGGSAFAARQVPPGSGHADAALAPKQPSQRLAALLREHRQLLAKIRQKQNERARLAARIAAAVSAAQHQGMPLLDEIVDLDRQLHAQFAELFAQQKPRKTQKIVRSVYGALQATGVLSSSSESDAAGEPETPLDSIPAEEPDEGSQQGDEGASPSAAEGEKRAGSALRELFHRLARAIHPDKVQDEPDKLARTEVMKEVTRAYERGDLARLIELEAIFCTGSGRGAAANLLGEEPADHDAQLEAKNRALRVQLEAAKAALRSLRRSAEAEFLIDLKRAAAGTRKEPTHAWLDDLAARRERLRELLRFVLAYKNGEVDIDDFARGPQRQR